MALSKVQDVGTANAGATSTTAFVFTVPAGHGCTAGNTVTACVGTYHNVTSVTDSKGNTWTVDAGTANADPYAGICSTRQDVAALAAGDTITFHFGTACTPGVVVEEWPGHLVADQTAITPATTSQATTVGPTGTTTAAEELILAAFVAVGSPTLTPGAGYTALPTAVATSFGRKLCPEYQIAEAAGTFTPTGDWGGSGSWSAAVVTYKATGSPPPPPSGATAKAWSGSAWAAHPVKRWNGSAWTQAGSIVPGSGGGPAPSGSAVYFAAADPFNHKISANPSIDSNSATWISMLAGTSEQGLSVTNAYGYPIFHASSSDPVVTIHATGYDTGTAYTFHLPADAAPNTGSDGHMVIVEPDGETTTDFYQATVSGGTITAVGVSQYKSSKTDGSSILTVGHLYGSRAAGLSLLGGAILGVDYTSGVIPHALSFACTVNANTFRAPAVHTDGTVSGGLPQGARIQLDPAYDISQLNADLRPIAKAMQDYGAIDVDSGSGGIQLFGESTATAGNVYPALWSQSNNLASFPWSSCRVLANSVNP